MARYLWWILRTCEDPYHIRRRAKIVRNQDFVRKVITEYVKLLKETIHTQSVVSTVVEKEKISNFFKKSRIKKQKALQRPENLKKKR